ncbi:dihydroneopterin aldolase [Ruminococcaceae bacterium YRB3002]|nr:dihydroneopterin aldolase [Ruminococcaceae bacterium YRB3002]
MDIIRLKNMEFFGHTGCLPEEKENGQKFIVTCEIFYDQIRGRVTDSLNDTCDYSLVYSRVKKIVEEDRGNLIEHLAWVIAGDVLRTARDAVSVTVTVSKPDCPVDGKFETMEAVISRGR